MIRLALIASLLFLSAHRSPAPVSETEKPTPTPTQSATAAPEQSATPKPKHSPTATENEVVATPIVAHASTPHPQKSASGGSSKLIYSPNPSYPVAERFARTPVRGSGEFRVTFGPNGDVTNVQTIRSTNHDIFDQAAIAGLRRWKARPGAEWSIVVPVDFRP